MIGLVSALIAVALTGVAMSAFSGETPQREVRNWFLSLKLNLFLLLL